LDADPPTMQGTSGQVNTDY